MVTIFSAPNYCVEFDNAGALLNIDESLLWSFEILKALDSKASQSAISHGSNGSSKSSQDISNVSKAFSKKDTLKRVVKAGDGTILATCQAYTRFLKSGVDYAIVSASMSCIDIWVQEFLRHEIPYVLVDYLVEYVCKPGYYLERHVLYKTHTWAEKLFSNLLSHSEEVASDNASVSNEDSSDDLVYAVCCSRDRGDVMLICSDEAGTIGCGIGTHIDCYDPPLESVPQDDWFCPNCSRSNVHKNPERIANVKPKRKRRSYGM